MSEDMVVIMDECTEIANALQRKTSADAGSATVAAALLMQVEGDREARDVSKIALDESKATFYGALKALGLDTDAKLDEPDKPDISDSVLPVVLTASQAMDLGFKSGGPLKVMFDDQPYIVFDGLLGPARDADPDNLIFVRGGVPHVPSEPDEKEPAILPGAEKPKAVGLHELAGTHPGPDAAGQGSQE